MSTPRLLLASTDNAARRGVLAATPAFRYTHGLPRSLGERDGVALTALYGGLALGVTLQSRRDRLCRLDRF